MLPYNYQLGQQSNVVRAPIVHHTRRIHPTQKPVAVLRIWINYLTNPGDIVLDCFSGSGSTIVAALRTWRKAIGIEADQGYVEKSRQRILADCPLFNMMGAITK